jgi:hypothetical protein
VAFSCLSTHRSLADSITAAALGVLTWWLSFLRGGNGWLAGSIELHLQPDQRAGPAETSTDAASSVVVTCSVVSALRRGRQDCRRASPAPGLWPPIIPVHDCWLHTWRSCLPGAAEPSSSWSSFICTCMMYLYLILHPLCMEGCPWTMVGASLRGTLLQGKPWQARHRPEPSIRYRSRSIPDLRIRNGVPLLLHFPSR